MYSMVAIYYVAYCIIYTYMVYIYTYISVFVYIYDTSILLHNSETWNIKQRNPAFTVPNVSVRGTAVPWQPDLKPFGTV